MIYLKSGERHILVLEPGHLIDMKAGELIHSPDGEVAIVYTPDIVFFTKEFKKVAFSPEEFDRIHKESLKRPERLQTPYHDTYWFDEKGNEIK